MVKRIFSITNIIFVSIDGTHKVRPFLTRTSCIYRNYKVIYIT